MMLWGPVVNRDSISNFMPSVRLCLIFASLFGAAASLLLQSKVQTRSLPPGPAQFRFIDSTIESGVRFRNEPSKTSQKYLIESMVGGVAVLDFDGDGLLDLFFVNGAALQDPMPSSAQPDKSDPRYWNRLYRNNGNGTFTDVTEKAGVQGRGYGMGVAAGDYDNDGHPDLYVTNFGKNILYHNNGDGTFTDITDKAGVAGGGWSAGACWLDYDRDGRLDLFVARYLEWDFSLNKYCGENRPGYRAYCHPDQFNPIQYLLYHNKGDGTFTEISQASGIARSPGKGLGVAVDDFDRDGWPDVFVANDSFPEQLFRNNGNGTFTETALSLGLAYDDSGKTFAGMGADFGDYDKDGWPDVFVDSLANQRYSLFRNAQGSFDYTSDPTGVARVTLPHSGWGTKFADLNNEGWKDLLVAQGHVMDNIQLTQPSVHYLEPLLLLRNMGGKFEDASAQAGPAFKTPLAARGVAVGDLNNDGLLDVAINCNNGPSVILTNASGPENNWLLVNTIGTASNRDGIGARLRLVSGSGSEQYGFVSTAGSYLSSSDKRVHFGLGRESKVRLLEITWPSGIVQQLKEVKANQVLSVREPASVKAAPRASNSD